MAERKGPETLSSDIAAMRPYWEMVEAMLGGAPAMRSAGEKYLPKFPNESTPDYDFRRKNAKYTNIFGDIVSTLAAKPFAKEIKIDGASDRLMTLVENIDSMGNHLHVFSGGVFEAGIANAISWILVDYTKDIPPGATVAQEEAMGARPYWVHVDADDLIAVYSEIIGGVEVIVHARIEEEAVVRDGYGEREVERIRVLDRVIAYNDRGEPVSAAPATWSLIEEQEDKTTKQKKWVEIGSGPVTIDVIPLVPFIAGRRCGSSWRVRPPLADAAYLQVEHFQQESGLKYAKELTAFPMLAGNGVAPPEGQDGKPIPVPVGPKTVLYAPPSGDGQHGEWSFIEPAATSLRFLAEDIKATEAALRELGRQPLTAQSGNITTVTAAFAGDKAHTVIEAWAINFKDTLENALKLTSMWLGENDEPTVEMNTDFSLDLKTDDGSSSLIEARKNGDLSQETLWSELQRRGTLGPEFDPEIERQRILDEAPGDMTPQEIDAATGT